jgi:hypothetical protein
VANIFVSYRRSDDPGFTQALIGRLEGAFSREHLFFDVDMMPGINFVRELEMQIRECEIVLAIIGPGWLDAKDDERVRRLENPQDFVRVELATALSLEKRVVPVLVNNARMPSEKELPSDLKPLAHQNAARLTHEHFRTDVDALIVALKRILAAGAPAERGASDSLSGGNYISSYEVEKNAWKLVFGLTLFVAVLCVALVAIMPFHQVDRLILSGLAAFLVGMAFSVLAIARSVANNRDKKTKIDLDPGEALLLSSPGAVSSLPPSAGRLYLTSKRFVFQTVAKGPPVDLLLRDIASVEPNLHLGLSPNALLFTTRRGDTHKFVAAYRQKWLQALKASGVDVHGARSA